MYPVSNQMIDKKLQVLRSRLKGASKQPTAVVGLYRLPDHLREALEFGDYPQSVLQDISDHMGFFLGTLASVKVSIGIESSDHMIVDPSKVISADRVGLYRVKSSGRREIQLTKKFRFEPQHVLAILAHEATHNHLHQIGIREADEQENEILTDVAAAYLGLGGLLLKGYAPIEWTSDHWWTAEGSGHTKHTIQIGYLNCTALRYAIYRSAIVREMREFADALGLLPRLSIGLYFYKLKRARRNP